MKKLILMSAVALFGTISAQTKFGVKAGYALSSLSAKYDGEKIESDAKSTFYVGALIEHKLTDKFALQAEVLYSPLGGKESESESETVMGQTYNYKYESESNFGTLLIPVGAKYFVSDGFAVGAGLNFGIITSAKLKEEGSVTFQGETETYSEEEDIKKYTNGLNLAPYIGAEYNLPMGLFFDARYNLGVSNLAKDSEDGTVKNSFFQIGVGYKF